MHILQLFLLSYPLAKMLQKYTRDFNVLNAKNHEREAGIVALE